MKLKNPIICALDLDDPKKAFKLAESLSDCVGGFKIGPRLFFKTDVGQFAKLGPLFLDFKFYDIPSTVLASVKSCYDLGASIVTVHASCGLNLLRELKKLEVELCKTRDFHIACVSVLTSVQDEFPPNWKDLDVKEHVQILTDLVFASGLNTVVCSALEAKELKVKYKNANIITPGIGFKKYDDQSRVTTPDIAISNGSDALVMGRAILESDNPKKTVLDILSTIS